MFKKLKLTSPVQEVLVLGSLFLGPWFLESRVIVLDYANNEFFSFYLAVLCAKCSGKMMHNSCAIEGKTQNSGEVKLEIVRDPVFVDWRNIHLCLVPF